MKEQSRLGVLGALSLVAACGVSPEPRAGVGIPAASTTGIRVLAPARPSVGSTAASGGAAGSTLNGNAHAGVPTAGADAAGAPSDTDGGTAGNNADGGAGTGGATTTTATDVLPHCLPHATSLVSVAGIFDVQSAVPPEPFDVNIPLSGANFSTTVEIHDLCGRALSSELFFDRTDDLDVDYHWVLLGAPNQEICSGTLTFDQNGALAHVNSLAPCAIPGTSQQLRLRLGTPTDSGGTGFDGIMQLGASSDLTMLTHDGNSEVVGAQCAADLKIGAPVLAPSLCKVAPTSSVPLILNLSTHEPLVGNAWHPEAATATSNLNARLVAHDEFGRIATFEAFFRHETDQSWAYHVLLADQVTPLELASGTLQFDVLGRLQSVHVDIPLRFPEADGGVAQSVTLDFGAPIDSGGNGTDGVTAYSTATKGAEPPVSYSWSGQPPPYACGGEPTSYVEPSLFVPLESLASADTEPWPTSASATITAYDVAAEPWSVAFFWRHSGLNQVDFKFVATNMPLIRESTVATVTFDSIGRLLHVDHVTGLRLPMLDGRPGPAINLQVEGAFDQGAAGYGDVYAAPWLVTPFAALNADGFKSSYCF